MGNCKSKSKPVIKYSFNETPRAQTKKKNERAFHRSRDISTEYQTKNTDEITLKKCPKSLSPTASERTGKNECSSMNIGDENLANVKSLLGEIADFLQESGEKGYIKETTIVVDESLNTPSSYINIESVGSVVSELQFEIDSVLHAAEQEADGLMTGSSKQSSKFQFISSSTNGMKDFVDDDNRLLTQTNLSAIHEAISYESSQQTEITNPTLIGKHDLNKDETEELNLTLYEDCVDDFNEGEERKEQMEEHQDGDENILIKNSKSIKNELKEDETSDYNNLLLETSEVVQPTFNNINTPNLSCDSEEETLYTDNKNKRRTTDSSSKEISRNSQENMVSYEALSKKLMSLSSAKLQKEQEYYKKVKRFTYDYVDDQPAHGTSLINITNDKMVYSSQAIPCYHLLSNSSSLNVNNGNSTSDFLEKHLSFKNNGIFEGPITTVLTDKTEDETPVASFESSENIGSFESNEIIGSFDTTEILVEDIYQDDEELGPEDKENVDSTNNESQIDNFNEQNDIHQLLSNRDSQSISSESHTLQTSNKPNILQNQISSPSPSRERFYTPDATPRRPSMIPTPSRSRLRYEDSDTPSSRVSVPSDEKTSYDRMKSPNISSRKLMKEFSSPPVKVPPSSSSPSPNLRLIRKTSTSSLSGTPSRSYTRSATPVKTVAESSYRSPSPRKSDVSSAVSSSPRKSQELYKSSSFKRVAQEFKKEMPHKWNPNAHTSKQPCDRCLSLASDKERNQFEAKGRSALITQTCGGCTPSCDKFSELPQGKNGHHLCRICFNAIHIERSRKSNSNSSPMDNKSKVRPAA